MKSAPRLPAYARTGKKAGRPRLEAPERLTLHFRPGQVEEIRMLAQGGQLAPFIMDCVRYAAQHRPGPAVRTSYHVQRIATDDPMWMQVAVDRWPDGRIVTRYTGTQYPDEATARDECARLNGART